MFRIGGPDRPPDKGAVEEERKKARQNVWFTLKMFTAYVATLRLVAVAGRFSAGILSPLFEAMSPVGQTPGRAPLLSSWTHLIFIMDLIFPFPAPYVFKAIAS